MTLYDQLAPDAQRRIREARRHYRYVDGVEHGHAFNHSTHLLRYTLSKLMKD